VPRVANIVENLAASRQIAYASAMIDRVGQPLLQLPADGRQSARALEIRKGTQRLMASLGWASLPEVVLASGRRADLLGVSAKGEIWIVEIKSSLEDLRADRKWPEYHDFCDRLSFATLADVEEAAFPQDCGLIVADAYAAGEVRPAPIHPLHASRRKEVLTRVARHAAMRLHILADPAGSLALEP
jgi:hypothetical protein